MKIAAIVDIRGSLKCKIITLPFISNDDRLFEIVDMKIKRDVDPDGLVLDLYKDLGYCRITPRDCKSSSMVKADVIYDITCQVLELNGDKVQGPLRERNYTDGRCIMIYQMYSHCELTLNEIGGYFGGRHHSTVIHHLRRYDNLYETNYDFQELADRVNEKLSDHPLMKKYVDI